MFIKTILAYINVLFSIVALISLYIIKCKYNFDFFDQFLFIKDINDISFITNIYYYFSHVFVCFIYGILFGIRNIGLISSKIIVYEILLQYIKFCKFNNKLVEINNLYLVLITIIVSISSYYIGTLISNLFYNFVIGLNNKFNIKIKFV
jgi:hypothetical protein